MTMSEDSKDQLLPVSEGTADYKVGRGKPPRTHRFKPGQSGNPAGRPKGRKSIEAHILDILDEEVPAQGTDDIELPNFREFIARKMILRAAAGDPRALAFVLAVDRDYQRSLENEEGD